MDGVRDQKATPKQQCTCLKEAQALGEQYLIYLGVVTQVYLRYSVPYLTLYLDSSGSPAKKSKHHSNYCGQWAGV